MVILKTPVTHYLVQNVTDEGEVREYAAAAEVL